MARTGEKKRRKPVDTQESFTVAEAEMAAMVGVSSKAELKRRMKEIKKAKSGGFESLGLCSEVYRGVKRKGYRVPTPIQRKTMPLILSGADVVAMARTGSGKTAAFLVPMLQKLRQHVPQAGVRALILSPTRDLALQTLKFTKELGRFTDIRTSLLVGGDNMEDQFEELAQNPDIIIATPGRLMHHLSEVEGMSLRTVEYVVFDEADSLFVLPCQVHLRNLPRLTLIFVSTKHHVEFLNILFREEGIEPSISYGDMDQDARKIHISKFRARKTMLLIVTDVAARGLDIPLLDNVVNWDFPPKPKLFVHRVGRAARAGRTGTAYSFVTSEDMPYLLDLHLFLSKPLRPAPSEEEILNDMEAVYSKIDQALANGETIYGRFPQPTLDLVSERVREVTDGSTELISLQKVCANAFQLYSKGKPSPSRESIRRIKDLPREGLHPVFRSVLGSNELAALAFSERLKTFRPKQTILEAEGEAARSKNAQGSNQWLEVMRKKRAIHEEVIKLAHQKHSADDASKGMEAAKELSVDWMEKDICCAKRKVSNFKDDEYYISSVPTNQHLEAGLSVKNDEGFGSSRLDAAVLDLVADDSTGLQKQKSQYHWDKRSKKYIKLNSGDRVTASGKIKNECGAKVKADKTGLYKKWKERSHQRISLGGMEKDNLQEGGLADRGNKQHYKGKRKRWSVPNANVPSELKDPEQVRKGRQQKANKIAHLKTKSSKGKRFSKQKRDQQQSTL
ncbi:hypothetical protein OPV22_026111 [Ensete ventricosum]|uniref:RNA helicase n=1 Tax=Ensete ventricosum TaxID=4639 RepID=A0AAV8QFL3_ENSVE|nr:hypothetical protein OPV22_026111 [Ensete ventricosum]